MEGDPTMGAWDGDIREKIPTDVEEHIPGLMSEAEGFLDMVRRSCLPPGANFYEWQWNALLAVWQDWKYYRIHVIQSVTGDGKTIISIGEILVRVYGHCLSSHKAFLAVPYRRLARAQGEELRHAFEVLRGRPPRENEIRVVEGRWPVRDIAQTRVVVGTFEHILQYLACAKSMVRTCRGLVRLGGHARSSSSTRAI
jgi:hypothetical protein